MFEPICATVATIEAPLGREEGIPRMPDLSGVEASQKKPAHRLTDNYFRLQHEEWTPQILDDAKLPAFILEGGKKLPLKHTRQRDEVVTWLLFETGGRISEVTELLLAVWASQGTHTQAR